MAKIRLLSSIATAITSFQNRLYVPPPDNISNITSQGWPDPLQPVQPIAPEGSSPLAWPFWQGQNLTFTPRPDAEYTAAQLKEMSMYPLARILIEQVKDSVSSKPWRIQKKAIPGETSTQRQKREQGDETIPNLTAFFEYPDGELDWSTWIRPFMDDVLTIDAGSILMRRTFSGKIVELRVIPGASITRYIDANGWTPKAPDPAYVQLWEGMPRTNLTTDQLVYRPCNIVTRQSASSHLYGCPPTEQMADEIKVGIERLKFVLAYYTEGSTPGVIQIVPKDATPDQVTKYMMSLNAQLAGNAATRRQIRVLQGFTEDNTDKIIELKEPILADIFDELHIRKLAYGFGTSAQRLLRMMNRAASESNQSAAEDEGELPWFTYLKKTMDYIIQRKMGYREYEWVPELTRELDAGKQSEIDDRDTKAGIRTRNEVRVSRGYDPINLPEMDMPMITTATGPIPLEGAVDRLQASEEADNEGKRNPKPAPGAASAANNEGNSGEGESSSSASGSKASKKKVVVMY